MATSKRGSYTCMGQRGWARRAELRWLKAGPRADTLSHNWFLRLSRQASLCSRCAHSVFASFVERMHRLSCASKCARHCAPCGDARSDGLGTIPKEQQECRWRRGRLSRHVIRSPSPRPPAFSNHALSGSTGDLAVPIKTRLER